MSGISITYVFGQSSFKSLWWHQLSRLRSSVGFSVSSGCNISLWLTVGTGTEGTKVQPTDVRTLPLAALKPLVLTSSPANTCSEDLPCMTMSIIILIYWSVSLHIGVLSEMEIIFKLPWTHRSGEICWVKLKMGNIGDSNLTLSYRPSRIISELPHS